MDIHGSVRIPHNSLFLAKQVGNLRETHPDMAILRSVEASIHGLADVTFVPGDEVASAAAWVKIEDTLLLFCDGIASAGQGLGTWNGYVGGPLAPFREPSNDYFAGASGKLLGALPLGYLTGTGNIVFAGWSLGGCECMRVALDAVDRGLFSMPKIATFGSPRFGNATDARRFEGQHLVRWMCDTDPVPNVPPRIADMPILPAIYGITGTIRLGNFVHGPGGVSINPAGAIADAEIPPLAPPAFPLQLATWLVGADASAGSPHFIGTYATRIQAWIDTHQNQNNPLKITTPIETTGQSLRTRLSREQAAAETEMFQNASRQDETRNSIPPELLFKAVKVGRLWYVTMGQTVVSIAPTKKRARGFANSGNDFLHRALKEGYVDSAQLVATLQNWVVAAQDSGSGIAPLLATSLP
jgi:Lipase (class 3)